MPAGLLVRAVDLIPLIPEESRDQFEEHVCDEDVRHARDLLYRVWPIRFSPVVDVFLFGDSDYAVPELECGVVYVHVDATLEELYLPGVGTRFHVWDLYE